MKHNVIDKLGEDYITEFGIGENLPLFCCASPRHLTITPLLRPFGAILGTALAAVGNTLGIKGTPDYMVTHAW